MRSILLLLFTALLAANTAGAQSGCTDPTATNYSPSATSNDGSCVYAYAHYNPVLRAALGAGINESSGLVYTDGKLWTHNDSGNPSDFFSVDTSTGAILQTVHVDNYPNVDWEDITADSAFIYLGDHGNNNGTRTNLKVLKVAKSDIGNAASVHVNALAIAFSYTDQTSFVSSNSHNFDCEALVAIRDSLYIFTKDRGDGQTRVYKMPKVPGTYALTPYMGYNVGGLITGADYNPVTKEIVLIGYLSGHFGSFLWFLNDYKGDLFFSGNKRRVEISNGVEWQTEGVCWLPNNRFFISCELTNNIPSSFYICNRSFQQTTGIAGVGGAMGYNVYPNPGKEQLYIEPLTEGTSYRISDVAGKVAQVGTLFTGDKSINIKGLKPGIYYLSLQARSMKAGRASRFVKE